MTLQTYLKRHDLTQKAFAKTLGVSKGLVWQWLNGRTKISGRMALAIERATQREVRRQDLLPELFRGMPA